MIHGPGDRVRVGIMSVMATARTCIQCGKPHHAHSLCATCYGRELDVRRPRIHRAKNPDYSPLCSVCGLRPHYAFGLCNACYMRQRRKSNPKERVNAYKYYKAHQGTIRERLREWRIAHPEQRRKQDADFRAAHIEDMRERKHQRRVRLHSQIFVAISHQQIYDRDHGRCQICGLPVERSKMSLDHILPVAYGGAHVPENVRLTHLKCNQRRSHRGTAQLRLI